MIRGWVLLSWGADSAGQLAAGGTRIGQELGKHCKNWSSSGGCDDLTTLKVVKWSFGSLRDVRIDRSTGCGVDIVRRMHLF